MLAQIGVVLCASANAQSFARGQESGGTSSSLAERDIDGIDKPIDMNSFTMTDYLFDGPGTRTTDFAEQRCSCRMTSSGGVVLATALILERIGRDKIPKGYMARVSVSGEDTRTGDKTFAEYWINPENVPSSRGIDTWTYRQAVTSDRGLQAFVTALSTNDPDRVGVRVKVDATPGLSTAKFWFVMRDGRRANMTMQIVPPPANK